VSGVAVEDVAHEALLRAWSRRAACRRPDDPWPWLRRIVDNEAMRYLGLRRAVDEIGADIDPGAPDSRLDAVLDRSALDSMIGGLSEADRALLRMHYEHDVSVAALAVALDVPEGTVKVRLHRARARVRAGIESADAASPDTG
jgi:RNA polymerase sigma-70 factor, ECF subfamily